MKKGFILIILAGIMWGTTGVFVNLLSPYGFTSYQMTATRILFSFIAMFLYCLFFKREAFKTRLKDILIYAICGISLYATSAFYFESMRLTSMAISVMVMYISPVPIMLISVMLLGEKFSFTKGIAVATMLIGCALVVGLIGDFKPNFLGIVMGLLSAAAYTVYNIFTKIQMKKKVNVISSTLYSYMFAAIAAIIFCRPWQLPALISQKPATILLTMILHGIFTCFLPYFLYSISLKTLSVGVAAAMSIIEPMTGALIGILVFKEELTVLTFIGMVLVVFSVFLLGISEESPKQNKILKADSK